MAPPEKKPRKKPGRPPARERSGLPINIRIEADLRDALDAAVAKSRRSITQEVTIALEEYLERVGLWPPPEDSDQ